MKPLTGKQNRFLRGLGHGLTPHVQLAEPVTEGAYGELERQIARHELIKVKAAVDDREARHALLDGVAARLDAALVQELGKTALLYRPNPDLKNPIRLPA